MVSRYKNEILIFFCLCAISIHVYSQENAADDSVSDASSEVTDSQESNASRYSVPDEESFILEPEGANATEIRPLGVWSTVRIFLVLIVLLIGLVGFVYFLKRMQTSYTSTNQEVIEIVASRGGAHGSAFHVIKIGTGYVFVGVSNGSVSLIKDFTGKEDIDEINLAISKAEEHENKKTRRNNFINKLRDKFIQSHNKSLARNYGESSVLALFKSRSDHL